MRRKDIEMGDLIFIGIILLFFWLAARYVGAADRL